MIKRFFRFFKSLFGGAVNAMESPRMILEENIRELNDQVPQINNNVASTKANVINLKKEVKRLKNESENLQSKIRAAIQNDKDDVAQQYAMRYEKVNDQLDRSKEQHNLAEQAYQKALDVKDNFMRERKKKIEEAKRVLRDHERSKMQSKVADTLEQFEVGGLDQTHDEMINRLNKETAKNEAMLEMASDSVDQEEFDIEEEAREMQAQEIVNQFKQEMNFVGSDSNFTLDKGEIHEAQIVFDENVENVPEKTIGRVKQK